MNLTKELEKKAAERVVLKDFNPKALLLDAHNEDIKTYNDIGLKENIFIDADETKAKRLAKAEAIYNQRAFEGSEIKDLCEKYHLKLLPLSDYQGEIPSDLAKQIREFGENINSTPAEMRSHLFVLAPPHLFKTTKDLKPVKLLKDPILFYRDPNNHRSGWRSEETDIFTQICNWGNDFSWFRRFAVLNDSIYDGQDSTVQGTVWVTFICLFLFYTVCIGFGAFIVPIILSVIVCSIISLAIYSTDSKRSSYWNDNRV